MDDTKIKIEQFLSKFFRRQIPDENEDIFSLGFVNSLFAMQLIMFIEKEFNIIVDNRDMNLDNFRTINAMIGFIDGKKQEMAKESDAS